MISWPFFQPPQRCVCKQRLAEDNRQDIRQLRGQCLLTLSQIDGNEVVEEVGGFATGDDINLDSSLSLRQNYKLDTNQVPGLTEKITEIEWPNIESGSENSNLMKPAAKINIQILVSRKEDLRSGAMRFEFNNQTIHTTN